MHTSFSHLLPPSVDSCSDSLSPTHLRRPAHTYIYIYIYIYTYIRPSLTRSLPPFSAARPRGRLRPHDGRLTLIYYIYICVCVCVCVCVCMCMYICIYIYTPNSPFSHPRFSLLGSFFQLLGLVVAYALTTAGSHLIEPYVAVDPFWLVLLIVSCTPTANNIVSLPYIICMHTYVKIEGALQLLMNRYG